MSLRDALADSEWAELADAMPRIELFVRDWWRDNYLPWFTDHGPDHSQRVADYALRIADLPDAPTDVALTLLERFILWGSAWLHDIGMQVIPTALGLGDEAHFARVRAEHPAKSEDIILRKASEIGLPDDPPLVSLIGLIARSHGTDYYESTRPELRQLTRVRNHDVRGTLLASILLMADEVDLHYERVKRLSGDVKLNTVSEAHALKHRCVNSAQILHRDDGDVQISLTSQRLRGEAEDVLAAVEEWIITKLRRQIALVETDFVSGFRGMARLSRAIPIQRLNLSVSPAHATLPPAVNVILADIAKDRVINHSQALAQAKAAIEEVTTAVICGRWGPDLYDDTDGREDVYFAISRWAATLDDVFVIDVGVLRESYSAATLRDVCESLIVAIGGTTFNASPAELFSAWLELVREFDGQVLMMVSSIDKLPVTDLRWFFSEAFPQLQALSNVSTIFSATDTLRDMSLAAPVTWVSTGVLDRSGVGAYLSRYVPVSLAELDAQADFTYQQFRLLNDPRIAALG